MGSIKVIGFTPAKKPANTQNKGLSQQQIDAFAKTFSNALSEVITEQFPELEEMDDEELKDWFNEGIDD